MPYGGLAGQGMFMIPDIDAQVWVEFEEGDLHRPIWTGTFWQQEGDVPEDAVREEPTNRMIQTKSGMSLQFDDADGEEQLRIQHPTGAEMVIDPNGSIALTDAKGCTVTLDADAEEMLIEDSNGNSMLMGSSGTTVKDSNGNQIEMGSAGITVKGQQIVLNGSQVMLAGQGGEPIIKGQSFLTMFMTHIHPTAAPGAPTAPPIPQGEMSTLSMKVMTS